MFVKPIGIDGWFLIVDIGHVASTVVTLLEDATQMPVF